MDRFSEIEDSITFYAFRYCLGRMTYAVDTCARYLIHNWDRLSENTQSLIVDEIIEAISKERAGMECDVESWKAVLRKAEEV